MNTILLLLRPWTYKKMNTYYKVILEEGVIYYLKCIQPYTGKGDRKQGKFNFIARESIMEDFLFISSDKHTYWDNELREDPTYVLLCWAMHNNRSPHYTLCSKKEWEDMKVLNELL